MKASRMGRGVIRRMGVAAVVPIIGLAVASSTIADVSRDVRHLPVRRAILMDDSLRVPGTWVEIWEDRTLAAGAAPGLGDVRVVDGMGQVVPAVLWQETPARSCCDV